MKQKFIHIGHHRSGSSFLQFEVIPKIKSLSMLPFSFYGGKIKIHDAFSYLTLCDDLFYDISKSKEAFKDFYDNKLKFNCLSYEGFVGYRPASYAGYQVKHIAERLHNIFGETKVLFVIRNQKTFMNSWYAGQVMYGYTCSFKKFIHHRKNTTELNWIKYSPIIKLYQDLYGKENVKVVLFEELFKKETILNILQEFGIDPQGIEDVDYTRKVNEGLTPISFYLSYFVSKHFGSKANYGAGRVYTYWRKFGVPFWNRVSHILGMSTIKFSYPEYEDFLYDYYHEDNLKTAELTGLPLNQYGYV